VPGGVTAGDVLERAGKCGALDVAHRRRRLHRFPDGEALAGPRARQRYVVRGVEMLTAVVDACAEFFRRADAADERLVDLRTARAMRADEREALHPAPPLLVHLRR